MLISRVSPISGEHTLDLPVTKEQLLMYKAGVSVQMAFPNLNSSQREFILTGYTEDDWSQFIAAE